MKLLGQKVCTFLILMDSAKWRSLGVVPTDAPSSNVQESTFGRAWVPQIRAETYEMKITLLGNSLAVQ